MRPGRVEIMTETEMGKDGRKDEDGENGAGMGRKFGSRYHEVRRNGEFERASKGIKIGNKNGFLSGACRVAGQGRG